MPMADPNSFSHSEESLLLSALCRTDTAAWCMLQPDHGGVSYHTPAFRELWKFDTDPFNTDTDCFISREAFAEALIRQGIDALQFFSLVSHQRLQNAPPIVLARKDLVRIHAQVRPISFERQFCGYLIRFRELVEHNVIDVMLDRISEAHRRLSVLSPRERQILRGVYDGRTNKAISILANISEKTVEKHRSRIMQKLKVSSSAELFQLASLAMLLADLQQPPDSEQLIPAPVSLETRTGTENS